jgi:hypothetical protein
LIYQTPPEKLSKQLGADKSAPYKKNVNPEGQDFTY